MSKRFRFVLAVAALLSVALSGCGSAKSSSTSSSATKDYNQTDVAFAANMLPHHMAGVQLGQLAAQKGVNPRIKSLGQNISTTQTREAGILRGFLNTFGAKPPAAGPIDDRGMLDMTKLNRASGTRFDRMWLDVISAHHSAAIQMAQIEQAGGQYGPAKMLAAAIINTQTNELTQFNALSQQMGG